MSTAPATRLAQSTTAALRARIASGEWPVGSRIPTEPQLCELLGVGRSTLREAVRALTTLGMLEPLTSRGTFVRSATPSADLLTNALVAFTPAELVGLRRALDVEAAQSAAAQRRDSDVQALEYELGRELERLRQGSGLHDPRSHCARFHALIAAASGNRLVAELDASLCSAFLASGLDQRIDDALDAALCIDEHDRIFTAIRGGDVGAAAHHMAVHADAALRSLSHQPIVTDLTTLVDRHTRRARGRDIA